MVDNKGFQTTFKTWKILVIGIYCSHMMETFVSIGFVFLQKAQECKDKEATFDMMAEKGGN